VSIPGERTSCKVVQRELYVVAEQSSIQPQVNTISNSEMGKIRVLFVDDEAGIRMTLPVILQRQGFDVTVAGSVPEALEVMGHQKFEVLLTDLNIGDPADVEFNPPPRRSSLRDIQTSKPPLRQSVSRWTTISRSRLIFPRW
jgi:hypothetical protein